MTNIEWIRTLSADELVDFINPSCNMCIYYGNCPDDCPCIEGKVKWLNAEHKEKLKPCANCGGKAKFFPYKSFNSSDTGCIRCIDCGMRTFTGQKFKVIEIWNRRADDGKVDGDCQDRRNQIHDRV